MNKKLMWTIVIVASVVLIAGVVLYIFNNAQNAANSGRAPIDLLGSAATSTLAPIYHIPSSTTITIGTVNGAITVKNFYASALGAEDEFVVLVRNSAYEITYDTSVSSFYIGIHKGPLADVRVQAETDFMNQLQVSQLDACKLDIIEGVDASVDPSLAGQKLFLSFCSTNN
jgi:hypothetical protein